MKLTNNWKIKTIIFTLISIYLAVIIAFVYFQINTRINSKIEIKSQRKISIFFISPINTKYFIGFTGKETFIIEKRPIKQIELVGTYKTIYINTLNDERTFSINGGLVSIKPEMNGSIFLNNIQWLLNYKFFLLLIILAITFLLLLVVAFLMWDIIKLNIISLIKKTKIIIRHFKILFFKWLFRGDGISINKNKNLIELKSYQKILLTLLFVMICFFMFHNLGKNQLSNYFEECRRTVVAQEMRISGNYIAPTICGKPYLNKLPLGHWFFIPFINEKINVEGKLRAVPISFIFLCALLIFYFINKFLQNKLIATLSALSFLCSFFVLNTKNIIKLDPIFASVCLLLFFINYWFSKANKMSWLFICSYLITFLGFLIKGFLILYFNWISLILLLFLHKHLKLLFSWKHFGGLVLFVFLTVGYFKLYSLYFDPKAYFLQQLLEMENYFSYDFSNRLFRFLSFWGLIMLMYSPVLMYLPFLFLKKYLLVVLKDKFKAYLFLLSIFGTIIFWFSPVYSLYYILMFAPLLMVLIIDIILRIDDLTGKPKIIIILIILLNISFPAYYFSTFTTNENIYFFYGLNIIISSFLIIFPIKYRINTLIFTLFCFLIISFFINYLNYNILGGQDDSVTVSKVEIEKLIRKSSGQPLMLFSTDTKIEEKAIFYLEYYSNKIIKIANQTNHKPNIYYLANKNQIKKNYEILDSLSQIVWYYNEKKQIYFDQKEYIYLVEKTNFNR